MKYIKFYFEGEQFYIELDKEQFALRQIIISFDNNVQISCRDDCLSEGKVRLDNDLYAYTYISKEEFEEKWIKYTEHYKKDWRKIKCKYGIGHSIKGTILRFYPQGIILDINGVIGCADYNKVKSNNEGGALYPGYSVAGIVSGFDEENMWIIVDSVVIRM